MVSPLSSSRSSSHPAKSFRCGAARVGVQVLRRLPVLVEEECARVVDRLMQVVVDVSKSRRSSVGVVTRTS
jgi:hypothetical protein